MIYITIVFLFQGLPIAMKKKKRHRATKNADKVRGERPEPEKAASTEEEFPGATDYGGLPARDLKKNLGGCG